MNKPKTRKSGFAKSLSSAINMLRGKTGPKDINKKIARTYRMVNKRQRLSRGSADVVSSVKRAVGAGIGTNKPEKREFPANILMPDPFARQSPLDHVRQVAKMDVANLKKKKK